MNVLCISALNFYFFLGRKIALKKMLSLKLRAHHKIKR